MIGVALTRGEFEAAREFFELFKTPWEQAVPGRKYPVVLSTNGRTKDLEADVYLIYGSAAAEIDNVLGIQVGQSNVPSTLSWGSIDLPVFGRLASFDAGSGSHTLVSGRLGVDYRARLGTRSVWRIGYDLFQEVQFLLSAGQPAEHARTPTLDLHIEFLRYVLDALNVTFVEVPPQPNGYELTCCLTHDVDFLGIRRHKFDRTLAGFVGRSSLKTLVDLVMGRRPIGEAFRNWAALLSLPFVFLKLMPDFWRPFEDYARIEPGSRSTFFLVPFKNWPGIAPDGSVHKARAVAYEMSEIQSEIAEAAARGSELGVHGIDAWRDAGAGRSELQALRSITGGKKSGIRMHWLYFSPDAPKHLECAGFDYDSTWGYNEAVGYRAGTSQVFQLPGTSALLELPLSIMDTALFFPRRLNRSHDAAMDDCRQIVQHARRRGGVVVVNWHDRSLAPERLWERSYRQLLDEIDASGRVWYATAGQVVDWFRWRRSIQFTWDAIAETVTVTARAAQYRPAGRVRISRPSRTHGTRHIEEQILDGIQPLTLDCACLTT